MVNEDYIPTIYGFSEKEKEDYKTRVITLDHLDMDGYKSMLNAVSSRLRKMYKVLLKFKKGFVQLPGEMNFSYNGILYLNNKVSSITEWVMPVSNIVFRKENEIIKGPYAIIGYTEQYNRRLVNGVVSEKAFSDTKRTIETILREEGFECLNCENVFVF